MTESEQLAIAADAERRLAELRRVATALWPDRDDAVVLSELVSVLAEIRAAEEALREAQP